MTEPPPEPRVPAEPGAMPTRSAPAPWTPGGPWDARALLVLLGITLLGACLRLYQLEQWSLSPAEAATWREATKELPVGFRFFEGEPRYTLVPVFALRWLLDLGLLPFHGEGWLRLLFAFLGIVTVPLAALVGSLFVGRGAALLAAGLLAVHPLHLHWSQSAAGQAPLTFFALCALGIGWGAHRRGRWSLGLLATGCIVAAACSHPLGCLTAPMVAGVVLVARWPRLARSRRSHRSRLLTMAGLLVVGLMLWSWSFLAGAPPSTAGLGEFAAGFAAFRLPVLLLALAGASVWFANLRAKPAGGVATFDPRHWSMVLAGWGPVLAVAGLGLCGAPVAAADAVFALPALLWLASAAALRCLQRTRAALGPGLPTTLLPSAMLLVALGLDLAVESYLYFTLQRGQRPEWRLARDAVLQQTGGRPVRVLAVRGFDSLLYYLRPNHYRDLFEDPHPGIQVERLGLDGRQLARDAGRLLAAAEVFVVLSVREAEQLAGDPAARVQLEHEYRLTKVLPCVVGADDASVLVYRLRPER